MLNHIVRSVAIFAFGLVVTSAADAQRGPGWFVVEVYSNADGSSQFLEFCGGFGVSTLADRTLLASSGDTSHSFQFPSNLPTGLNNPCFLVGTQGFADLNRVQPDYIVPNGFLFVPNGSVELTGYDTVKYTGLPTNGLDAIGTDTDERPFNGDPSTGTRSATATNFAGASYTFGVVPFVIGPGITGAWYDPAQSGHGLFIEVLSDNRLFASWFAFNPAGTGQSWFTGVGTYSGNTATINAVDMPTGGRWIPNFDPTQIVRNPWGTLTLTFSDCNHGEVDFNSVAGYGAGSMNLTRLTQPAGLICP